MIDLALSGDLSEFSKNHFTMPSSRLTQCSILVAIEITPKLTSKGQEWPRSLTDHGIEVLDHFVNPLHKLIGVGLSKIALDLLAELRGSGFS